MLKTMASFVSNVIDHSKSIIPSLVLILVLDYVVKEQFGFGNSDIEKTNCDLNTDQIPYGIGDPRSSSTLEKEEFDDIYTMAMWVANLLYPVLFKWSLKLPSIMLHSAAAWAALCLLIQDGPARYRIMTNAIFLLPLLIEYNVIPIIDNSLFIVALSVRLLLLSFCYFLSEAGNDPATKFEKMTKLFFFFLLFFIQNENCDNKESFIILACFALRSKLKLIYSGSRKVFLAGLCTVNDEEIHPFEMVRRALDGGLLYFKLNRARKAICVFWLVRLIYYATFLCGHQFLDLDVGIGFQCVLLNGTTSVLDIIAIAWIFSMLNPMFGEGTYMIIQYSNIPDDSDDSFLLFKWTNHLPELSIRTGLTSISAKDRLWALGLNILWMNSICLEVIIRSISKPLTSFMYFQSVQLRALLMLIIFLTVAWMGLSLHSPVLTEIMGNLPTILTYTLSFNLNILGICGACSVCAVGDYIVQKLPVTLRTLTKAIDITTLLVLVAFVDIFLCSILPDYLSSIGGITVVTLASLSPYALKSKQIVLTFFMSIGGSYFLIKYLLLLFPLKWRAILEWFLACSRLTWNSFTAVSILIVVFIAYKKIEVIRSLVRKFPFQFAGIVVFLLVFPGAWYLSSRREQISEFHFHIFTHVGRFILQLLAILFISASKYIESIHPESELVQKVSETIVVVLKLFYGFVDAVALISLSTNLLYNGWSNPITLPVLPIIVLLSEQKIPIASGVYKLRKMMKRFDVRWTWNTVNTFPDASIEKIENLRDDVCPNCLEGVGAAKLNHCGHALHAYCLRWLLAFGKNKSCPYCQAELRVAYTDEDWSYSYVVLNYPDHNSGPGLQLGVAAIKLPNEELLSSIIVATIIPGGPAALIGEIKPGDIVERINGVSMIDKSLESATNTMDSDNTYTKLYIKRRGRGTSGPKIIEVELMLDNGPIGFNIECTSDEIRISKIHETGAAIDCGRLEIGDKLLAVGDSPTNLQSLENITVDEAEKRLGAFGINSVLIVMTDERQSWINRLLS